MSGPARVVFAGLCTWDVVHLVTRLPSPDEKVAALDFFTAAGGPATNAAVACAHLGSRPTLVTALPSHPVTSLIADDLAGCGVELAIAAGYEGPPISASIMVTASTGERAIVSPTSAATDLLLEGGHALDTHNTLCVLVDGYFPSISLPIAREAREHGIPVVLDAGSSRPYTDEFLQSVDVVAASAVFRPPGTDGSPESVFAYLRARGVMWAAITRGGDSILYMCPGGSGEITVPPVKGVVDTLGAGDFFHGALAHRIATLGLDGDRFPADLAFAASVVAESITSFGTRGWLS
ncbi:MAG: PfkB family carbohydrate kinase [Demequina sp.]|jgi:sugar/nucleoside kinase (ribokinase family)|nr:PfkB family carbohydrate kinase [Demequina sp.]